MKRFRVRLLAVALPLLLAGPGALVEAQAPGPGPKQLVGRSLFFNDVRDRVADLFVFDLPAPAKHIRWQSFYMHREGLLVQLDFSIVPKGGPPPRMTFAVTAWQAPEPVPTTPAELRADAVLIGDWSLTIHDIMSHLPTTPAGPSDDDDGDEGEADASSGGSLTLTDRRVPVGEEEDDDGRVRTLTLHLRDAPAHRRALQRFFGDKLPALTTVLGSLNHVGATGGWEHLALVVDTLLGENLLTGARDPEVAPPLLGSGTGGGFLPKVTPGCDEDAIKKECDFCDTIKNDCLQMDPGADRSLCVDDHARCIEGKAALVKACRGTEDEECQFQCPPGEPCVEGCGQEPCQFQCPPGEPCVEGCNQEPPPQ